jgi:cytochrome c peroxidase
MIRPSRLRWIVLASTGLILAFGYVYAQQPAPQTQPQTTPPNPYLMGTEGFDQGPRGLTSYMPVAITESFAALMARLSGEKPGVEQQHSAVLNERYDLSDRPAQGVTMDRTKPIQEGVRVKLPAGVTWESLAAMSPDQIRDQNLYPKGFYPLPHPKHQEGGFVIPHLEIDAIKQQDGRDLKRFDIDFDLPDHFLAEFTSCDVLKWNPFVRQPEPRLKV